MSSKKRSLDSAISPVEKTSPEPPAKRTKDAVAKTNLIAINPRYEFYTFSHSKKDTWIKVDGIPKNIHFDKALKMYEDVGHLPFRFDLARLDVPNQQHIFISRLSEEYYVHDLELHPMTCQLDFDKPKMIVDQKDGRLKYAARGPLFITVRKRLESQLEPIPDKLIEYLRSVVAGHKFMFVNPARDIIFKEDLMQCMPNRDAISFSAVFHDPMRHDGWFASSTLLVFTPKQGCNASVTASLIVSSLHDAMVKHGQIGQPLGAFFELLGLRRLPYHQEAIQSFAIYHSGTVNIKDVEDFIDVIGGMVKVLQERTESHTFILAKRIKKGGDAHDALSSDLSGACSTIHQTMLLC